MSEKNEELGGLLLSGIADSETEGSSELDSEELISPLKSTNFGDVWLNLDSTSKGAPAFRWAIRVNLNEEHQGIELTPFILDTVFAAFRGTLISLDAKRYVFQLERGEQGSYHIQGYVNLKIKKRETGLVAAFREHFTLVWVKPARDESQLITYCTKEETRVAGPVSYPSIIEWRRFSSNVY
jgi:Putative viral replication protein